MSLVDLGKRLLDAARRGDTDTVRTLMSTGAPFTTDWLGTSPLHLAAQYGHQETAQVLLRAGISRDARTKVDRTPLHVACQEGHLPLVQLLIQSSADIDAKDMLKMTPLHWCTEKSHLSVIALLIRNGADMTQEDKFGRTPIDIALANGRTDIAHLFQLHQSTSNIIEDEASMETPESLVTETVSTSESVEGLLLNDTFNQSQPDGSGDTRSPSVLATLAVLAQGTAEPPTTNRKSTNNTLHWLSRQGITMISGDSDLIASAVKSGQTLTVFNGGDGTRENGRGLEQQITEESVIENCVVLNEHGETVMTMATSSDVGDEEGDITEESLELEGEDRAHLTDEDGNTIITEEVDLSVMDQVVCPADHDAEDVSATTDTETMLTVISANHELFTAETEVVMSASDSSGEVTLVSDDSGSLMSSTDDNSMKTDEWTQQTKTRAS